MSISLYVGTPGSGKSLHAAEDAVNALFAGKTVVCNYGMNFSRYRKVRSSRFFEIPDDELTPSRLIDIARSGFKPGREGQGLCIIDEASILFNCREFSRADRAAWVRFFAQHRKFGWDVILITQFDRAIDRQIRALVEFLVMHRRFDNMGAYGALFRLLRIPVFVTITYWYQLRHKCKTKFSFLDKKVASVYNSWNAEAAADNIIKVQTAAGVGV